MAGVAPVVPRFRFSDSAGVPLANGTVTVYLAGTTTLTDTWQDSALTTLNTNPITLDANGECLIWLDSTKTYKFLAKNAVGATASGWPVDNISGAADPGLRTDLADTASALKGAALAGHKATLAYAAGTVGAVLNDVCINVRMSPWLATGNGTTDDFAAVQDALTAAAGKTIYFPEGTYLMTGGTPVIPSNTTVVFEPGAVLSQPNKGNYAAFAIDPGSINITIEGADLRGPWYGAGPGLWQGVTNVTTVDGDTLSNLQENVGIYVRGRWYQREILGYTATQMDALTDTCSRITIRNCRIDGFGQEAIFADRVTGFEAEGNTLLNCGRGGIRMYGVVRGMVDRNVVGNISPGWSGNYPNWNVYGITCTRMQGTVAIPDPNLTISRPTQDVSVTNNTVYNCYTWKSLDNHGSKDIRFIGNKCLNSYIGLGLDQGGTDSNRGIAPAVRNIIMGNVFESSGAQYMRAGVTLYGNNSTDQACESPVVVGNTFIGYGGSDTDAAISLSNCRNATVVGNTIKNAPRAGISLALVIDDATITGNTIDDPKMYVTVASNAVGSGYTQAATSCTVSGGGGTGLEVIPRVVDGQVKTYDVVNPGTGYTSAPTITVEGDGTLATATATLNPAYGIISAASVNATVDANTFHNRTQATNRAISLSTPTAGYAVKVSSVNRFVSDTGTMTKVYPSLANEGGGGFGRIPHAYARFDSAGALVGGVGITAAASKTGIGAYTVTFDKAVTSVNDGIPDVGIYNGTGAGTGAMASTTTFDVTTRDAAGAAADRAFTVVLWNDNP